MQIAWDEYFLVLKTIPSAQSLTKYDDGDHEPSLLGSRSKILICSPPGVSFEIPGRQLADMSFFA